MKREWQVYLSGEIHSDWREQIMEGAKNLPISFSAPVTDHAASDRCGVEILGAEEDAFWQDRKRPNSMPFARARPENADIVVVRFGEQYRQWNAAFDAGFAAALGKPLIILHPEAFNHALKEVDAAALAVARMPEQVVRILEYVIEG